MDMENSVIDSLLLLYLMKNQRMLSQKKLIKLIFLSELEMEKNNIFGFDFHFIRYKYGPYSFEIPGIQNFLRENGIIDLISLDFGLFTYYNSYLPKYGKILLNEFKELFIINKKIIGQIDLILKTFDNYSGSALENYCYNLKINNNEIHKMQLYQNILNPTINLDNKEKFFIDSEWIETFFLLLDKNNYKQIKRAIEINKKSVAKKYPHIIV